MQRNTNYRPEIDGLRSIAVLSVLFYHLELPLFGLIPVAGGFLGVDVFFVISGYLITGILLREITKGTFSFAEFYRRRAKRLLPALLVVMFFSLPIAWFLLFPQAHEEYSWSILASLFFSSNIFFLTEDAYTAQSSRFKPFLHTWSLSIEEQFYLLFPIILIVVSKFNAKYFVAILGLLLLLSLEAAQFSSTRAPDHTFYLIHTRAWELLAGALLASLENKKIARSAGVGAGIGALMPSIGLFLILHSVVFFNHQVPHPSFNTIFPIFGTALLIFFMRPGELISDILATKVFTSVGLISYSLYLWHWPVIVFVRIYNEGLNLHAKLLCLVLSFCLATISYFVVEKRLRYSVSDKKFFGIVSGLFFLILSYASLSILSHGYEFRFDHLMASSNGSGQQIYTSEARSLNRAARLAAFDSVYHYPDFDKSEWLESNSKTKVLIIGDSHADAWSFAFPRVFGTDNFDFLSVKYLGCRWSVSNDGVKNLEPQNKKNIQRCASNADILNSLDVIESIDKIFFVSHRPFSYRSNRWRFDVLKRLKQLNPSIEIFVFGNYFQTNSDLYCSQVMQRERSSAASCLKKSSYPSPSMDIKNEPYYELTSGLDFSYIDIIKPVCDPVTKLGCPYEHMGVPYMEDWNHLTPIFTEFLLREILFEYPNLSR